MAIKGIKDIVFEDAEGIEHPVEKIVETTDFDENSVLVIHFLYGGEAKLTIKKADWTASEYE